MKRALLCVVVGGALGLGLAALPVAGGGGAAIGAGRNDPQPCRYDRERFCHGVERGQGRVVNCLLRHFDQLMPACKRDLENRKAPK